MSVGEWLIVVFFVLTGPVLCALIAQARGIEWWIGFLLGFLSCFGLVLVCVMRSGPRTARSTTRLEGTR